MQPTETPVHFINLEYFFRILYNLLHGGGVSTFSVTGLLATAAHIWLVFTVIAYIFSLAAIGLLVYSTMRLYQIRKEEEPRYETIEPEAARQHVEHSRWSYIQSLIESGQESDWRQAIIEADIMLEDTLRHAGYAGEGVGDKLRSANPAHFRTLQDAGEAHGVRNRIAHDGSAYQLTNHTAYQAIQKYQNVFEEFGEI
ncbi:MAG: hypothetical protein V4480_02710 [Patescibacteria group bacterium]